MPYNVWQRNVVDESGNVIPLAEIEIFHAGESTKPVIYSSDAGASLTNPFDADIAGFAQFYTISGFYDIAINGTVLWENIQIGAGEYDTAAQLALSANRIGDRLETKGCLSIGDAGHGTFIVEAASGAPDGYSRVLLPNGNHAVLQMPYKIRQFGVTGDGSDETTKLQRFIDASVLNGQNQYDIEDLRIRVVDSVYVRPATQTISSDTGDSIHFMHEAPRPRLFSSANGAIYATTAISNIIHLAHFTPGGDGTYANFYATVENIFVDGGGVCDTAIFIDEAMHVNVYKNIITGVERGVRNVGYGVHHVFRNVIRATVIGIDYLGGGDSYIENNDIYIYQNNSGIKLRPFGGNTVICRNIFTPHDASVVNSGCVGVLLVADEAGDDVKALGAVKVYSNAFDGMRYGVYGAGYSNANLNLSAIEIYSNYIAPANLAVTNTLAYFENAINISIHHNSCGIGGAQPIIYSLCYIKNCFAVHVNDNQVNGTRGTPITIENSNTVYVKNNYIESGSVTNSALEYVLITGTSANVNVTHNEIWQLNASGATVAVRESGSADYNKADYNKINGLITTEYIKSGANSVFRSRIERSSAPVSGTWLVGAINTRLAPTAGGFLSDVCVTAGTPGTWKAANPISA